jgi:hypothetical protein
MDLIDPRYYGYGQAPLNPVRNYGLLMLGTGMMLGAVVDMVFVDKRIFKGNEAMWVAIVLGGTAVTGWFAMQARKQADLLLAAPA